MKGFRRVVALFISLCMLVSTTTLASAQTKKRIAINYDAVELLYSLNIIDRSYEDFDPNELLTRAQVAKMIYVTIKGGNDDEAINFKGHSNTFTDVNGHWAEGYINYTYATTYLVGYGDGTFRPENKMTGYQFFKIVLAVIGYDTQIEGFEGANWDHRVIQRAMESGILLNYSGEPNKHITRGDAYEILYNMLHSQTVEYNNKKEIKKNQETVADSLFNLKIYKGILMANDIAGLGVAPLPSQSTSWVDVNNDGIMNEDTELFQTPTDINLLGHHVTVITNSKLNNVYDVHKTRGMNNVLEITPAALEQLKDEDIDYFINFSKDEDQNEDEIKDGLAEATSIKYLDNSGDGQVDLVLSMTYKYAQVLSFNISSQTNSVEFKLSDQTILTTAFYAGLNNVTVGSRIVYLDASPNMSKGIVRIIRPKEGTITSFSYDNLYFNNVEYTYSQLEGTIDRRPGLNIKDQNVNKDALLYSYEGEVLEVSPLIPDTAQQKFAFIFQIKKTDTRNPWVEHETYDRTYTARAIFEDGSEGSYQIAKVDGRTLPIDTTIDASPSQGMYTFKINSFGTIELTSYSYY